MDVTLQRHCARYIYVVPEGLRELMSDISREVLRSQPEDIYTFVADYLDALLITRENARISARFVQYLTEAAETIVELLSRTGMTREQANRSAEVIQDTFRTWSDRKGILKEDEDDIIAKIIEDAGISEAIVQASATVIQHAFKAFKARQQREAQLLSGIIDWRVAARSAIRLYRRTGISPEEAKRAADLIKAAYKGYYTRRAIRLLNEQQGGELGGEEEEEGEDYSTGSWERKGKGVRIDYTSVVPHVDFGDEELISKDTTSVMGEEALLPEHHDVMTRIFGDITTLQKSDEDFIKEIMHDLIRGVVGGDDFLVELPNLEDRDSETDTFLPPVLEEQQEQMYSRPQIVPIISQEELDQELRETKKEMIDIQKSSQAFLAKQESTVARETTESSKPIKEETSFVTNEEVLMETVAEETLEVIPEDEQEQEQEVEAPVELEAPVEEQPLEQPEEAPPQQPPEAPPAEQPEEVPPEQREEVPPEQREEVSEPPEVPTESPAETPTEVPVEEPKVEPQIEEVPEVTNESESPQAEATEIAAEENQET